jgi:hypothetical protein
MYSFSITKKYDKKDRVIAKINGGENDGEFIKLEENDRKNKKKPEFIKHFSPKIYEKELKQFKPSERQRMLTQLEEAFYKGFQEEDIIDKRLKPMYKNVLENENKDDEIVLDDGKLSVMPEFDKFQLFYLFGSSGSGKSYFMKEIALNYKKMYPKREVYLISKLDSDKTLDSLKFIKRVKTDSFLEEIPTAMEFSDSLVLIDDYEGFETTDKQMYSIIIGLINDISSMGRHHNINICIANHLHSNFKATRLMLNEATHVVVYPSTAPMSALKYLLGHHCGLETKQINIIKKVPSRWICIHRHAPNYIISEHDIKLI